MLSYQKSIINSDSDDDELPSLAERIKAAFVCQKKNNISAHISSGSDEDESSFLEFSERIRNTPISQVKFNQKEDLNTRNEVPKILKNAEKNNFPPLNIKLDFSATSESEDDESESLNSLQKIQSTPQIKPLLSSCYISSESDSDEEVFSNLLEKFQITPRTENKENCCSSVRNKVLKIDEFRTPLSPIQKTKFSCKDMDSESDESFSNFVEILKTPLSMRKVTCKAVDSESDESFSNFVEKLRTPMSVNKNIQHKENEIESDDSFLNNSRKQVFKTPRSQMKNPKNADLLSSNIETKQCNYPLLDTTNSLKISKSENEKEFIALFQPENISSTFLRKRESYTRKLYDFYNRKVFNSQLPADMPLIYNGALKTTAGMCCCCIKNGTYLCSIKLSSSILNSFDRLKETLLHEMCHAAVWIINRQRKVRHGPLWQIWASRCKMMLPFIDCPTRCHNYDISYSVWYKCPKCQWKTGRCKQVKKYHGALCKRCKTPIVVTYA